MTQKESEFEINKCILKDGNKDDKSQIFLEQKELNKQIPALKKEIETLSSNSDEIISELESMTKETLSKVLSGADKDKLFEAVEQKGISYIVLSEEIAKVTAEVVKKK